MPTHSIIGVAQVFWRTTMQFEKYLLPSSAIFCGCKIAYPRIGAGLARGDWNVIAKIIDEQLHGEEHTLVNFASTNVN